MSLLAPILERYRRDAERRRRRLPGQTAASPSSRSGEATVRDAVRRGGDGLPKVIAEVKFRSPSAGSIRRRFPGAVESLARDYASAGAAAVSVLADQPGFGGSPLDVRRAADAVQVPVLFKGFVVDRTHVELARRTGARLVLLLVRALEVSELHDLVRASLEAGLEPVVEAKDEEELALALDTEATIVGVNARDLGTFRVDPARAKAALRRVPPERVAIQMSGIRTRADLLDAADGRADAVLIGESLMRAPGPGAQLEELLKR